MTALGRMSTYCHNEKNPKIYRKLQSVNFGLLTISAISSIIDIRLGSKCAPAVVANKSMT